MQQIKHKTMINDLALYSKVKKHIAVNIIVLSSLSYFFSTVTQKLLCLFHELKPCCQQHFKRGKLDLTVTPSQLLTLKCLCLALHKEVASEVVAKLDSMAEEIAPHQYHGF